MTKGLQEQECPRAMFRVTLVAGAVDDPAASLTYPMVLAVDKLDAAGVAAEAAEREHGAVAWQVVSVEPAS